MVTIILNNETIIIAMEPAVGRGAFSAVVGKGCADQMLSGLALDALLGHDNPFFFFFYDNVPSIVQEMRGV